MRFRSIHRQRRTTSTRLSVEYLEQRTLLAGTTALLQTAEVQKADFDFTGLPGDANRDGTFDQLDIVQVMQAGKYSTSEPAVWHNGDWNANGLFDALDVALAQATGCYLIEGCNTSDVGHLAQELFLYGDGVTASRGDDTLKFESILVPAGDVLVLEYMAADIPRNNGRAMTSQVVSTTCTAGNCEAGVFYSGPFATRTTTDSFQQFLAVDHVMRIPGPTNLEVTMWLADLKEGAKYYVTIAGYWLRG